MASNQKNFSESQLFPYESEHYDRRYLDCWRRQAIVFLETRGAGVDFLFYNCLASTDRVFEELILSQKPKYAFTTPSIDDEGLSLIGWQQVLKTYDTFDMAKEDIHKHLEETPFVIIMGSVFYLPHCPEFQMDHLNHSIVLSQCNGNSIWSVVDDDAASTLRRYEYHQSYIENYFNNNGSRLIRYFKPVKKIDTEEMRIAAVDKCAAYISSMEDSYRILTEIELIANNPYESVGVRARKIHESFSIYSGSRNLFARFAERVLGDQVSAASLKEIASESIVIKYAMAKAEITGRFNVGALVSRCERLVTLESQAISSIREKLGCS